MDAFVVWLLAVLFVVLGLLVSKYPKLIAGYNTMSPERQKKVDAKGLAAFMCRSFCMMGLLVVVLYYLLTWGGMNREAAVLVSVLLVPILVAVYILIGAQRYDYGR